MPQPREVYDPHISALLDQCADDWGKPEENVKNLLPYGIEPFDRALYGIDIVNGELILVQGEEKNCKTTFLINVLINSMLARQPEEKPLWNIDTLESSMNPKRYRDTLIANLATRKLLRDGHKHREYCPVCHSDACRQLDLSPEFLRYNKRSEAQQEAIDWAVDVMRTWPLMIHGASPKQGDTRDLSTSVIGTKNRVSRWERLIQEEGVKVVVTDHVQQYGFEDNPTDDEKQIRAVAAISDVVARYGIACFLISQVSLTSAREAAMGGKLVAAGGAKGAQEANVVFSVRYKGESKMHIAIEESRRAASFGVWHPLEDVSGAFYGAAEFGSFTAREGGNNNGRNKRTE